MRNNNLEDALVAIRRIMRVTEINSLSLAKKTKLTPTQMIVLQVIATTDEATPSFISNRQLSKSPRHKCQPASPPSSGASALACQERNVATRTAAARPPRGDGAPQPFFENFFIFLHVLRGAQAPC